MKKLFSAKTSLAIASVLLLTGLSAMLRVFVLDRYDLSLGAVLPAVVALLTNNARTSSKESALATNPLLTSAAQAKADDMAKRGYFAHMSPDGKMAWYWIDKSGYKYEYAGENLAVNFDESDKLVSAWMDSPTHKQNILNPHYTDIGIGTATGTYKGRTATFVVQLFASPARK